MTTPIPSFAHVARMTDARGMFEHADGTSPRYEHGYCVDDVARALLVVCRQQPATDECERLAAIYFQFVSRAQAPDGRCHNRLDVDGNWHDEPTALDWWGRALWGFGTAAARSSQQWLRAGALARFNMSVGQRSEFLHPMAFAALGAAEIVTVDPGHRGALDLLADTAAMVGRPDFTSAWPWPQERMRYANGSIAEAVIAAGAALGDQTVLADGLDLLRWLLTVETRDDHLSVIPVGGWTRGEPRPGFDQQPIEAAALADACARAYDLTGEQCFADGLDRSVRWFLGDNDMNLPLYDADSGGGYDALTRKGCNTNEGAESTLAMLSAMQHGQRRSLIAVS